MEKANTSQGGLYPLVAHLSALLDAPDLLAVVEEESKRYTLMALREEARLGFDHTTELWHPSKRPSITWKETDRRYIAFNLRWETLSQFLTVLEIEDSFFSSHGDHLDCLPRISHILLDVCDQLEDMDYAALDEIPEGSFVLQSLPPIQKLEHEGRVMRELARVCLDNDLADLYAKQQAFLDLLLKNWVRELLPVEEVLFLGKFDLYVGRDFIAVTPR